MGHNLVVLRADLHAVYYGLNILCGGASSFSCNRKTTKRQLATTTRTEESANGVAMTDGSDDVVCRYYGSRVGWRKDKGVVLWRRDKERVVHGKGGGHDQSGA